MYKKSLETLETIFSKEFIFTLKPVYMPTSTLKSTKNAGRMLSLIKYCLQTRGAATDLTAFLRKILWKLKNHSTCI
jgi:hypothetical protein